MESITHLIEGCKSKNHNCQKTVYERYHGYAFKIVFRFIFNYERANEIVNDGFVKAFNHFHNFRVVPGNDDETLLMAWLKRIMINASIDELRRTRMKPEMGPLDDCVWDISERGHHADQLLMYKDLILMIRELPATYRIIFSLYVIDGYNHVEIASLLSISEGTSKSGLFRARAILQTKIKVWEEEAYAIEG